MSRSSCSPPATTTSTRSSGSRWAPTTRARWTCTCASFAGSSATSARSPPSGASGTRSLTMLRSLRTRLALLFAGTLLLATVIAGAASIRLYQSYNRDQTERDLRHQVGGVASYYAQAVIGAVTGHRTPTPVTAEKFEQICGCRLYWA